MLWWPFAWFPYIYSGCPWPCCAFFPDLAKKLSPYCVPYTMGWNHFCFSLVSWQFSFFKLLCSNYGSIISSIQPIFDECSFVSLHVLYKLWTWNWSASSANQNKINFMFVVLGIIQCLCRKKLVLFWPHTLPTYLLLST